MPSYDAVETFVPWTSFDCKGEKIRMVDGWPTIIFWLADMSWNFGGRIIAIENS
jgi:hypothetical protein